MVQPFFNPDFSQPRQRGVGRPSPADYWQNRLPLVLKRPFFNPETTFYQVRRRPVPFDSWQNRLPVLLKYPFYNPETVIWRVRLPPRPFDIWQNKVPQSVPPTTFIGRSIYGYKGLLAQSTAVNVTVQMISSSDHVNGATGQTLTVYLSKAGGFPMLVTPAVTELDPYNWAGLYELTLTVGMTDTLGELSLQVTGNSADPTDVNWQVTQTGGYLTLAQIATAIFQDTTLTDFQVPDSIGQSLYTGVPPGTANGLFIAGNNAITNVTFTGTFEGSVQSVIDPVRVLQDQPMPGDLNWTVPR